ncbi:MAG: LamG domain-containing protein, partial [Planctomycetota bacterium]
PLPPNWVFGNIGTNYAEQLYVALSDGVNTDVVEHNDVNAATLTSWQEWNIPLTDFATVNLDGIKKVYIGLGDRDVPVQGGSGAIYVDDIRGCPPRCVPSLAKPVYDLAQPYDCIVNELDLALVGIDWLMSDEVITTQIPSVGPIAQYLFEGNYSDSAGTNHGDPCGSPVIVLDSGRGSNVVDLDGSSWVATDANAIDLGIDGNTPKTVTAWAYTRSFNDGGIFDMGAYIAGQNFCLRTLTTDNLWRTQLWGGAFDIDFTYDSLDKWVHFALVDEGSQTTVYADGRIVAQAPRNLATSGVVPFRIGNYNVANYFDGRIDDVRIYNYGLSQAEVAYIASDSAGTLHLPILSVAEVYQGETPGNQWINFNDYALIADKYLEQVLWPVP